MKKCVYCGKELDDSTKRCPRCNEYQDDHKDPKDMYKEAYDEFYKNLYNKAEDKEEICNAFETDKYHRDHNSELKDNIKDRLRAKKKSKRKNRKRNKSSKSSGSCLFKLLKWCFILVFILGFALFFIEENFLHGGIMTKSKWEPICEEALDYYYGRNGVEQDFDKAYDILEGISAKKKAKYYMANLLLYNKVNNGDSEEDNILKGMEFLKESAKDEYYPAILDIGIYHMDGSFEFEKNITKSIANFEKACSIEPIAYYYLGYIYDRHKDYGLTAYSDEVYKMRAIENFKLGASEDEPLSKSQLAYKYIYETDLIGEDIEKGIKLFEESAADGIGFSNYYLGMMYYNGENVKKDYKKAAEYLKVAKDKYKGKDIEKKINDILKKIEK